MSAGTADILRKAKALIKKPSRWEHTEWDGITRNRFGFIKTRCAAQALNSAGKRWWITAEARRALCDVIGIHPDALPAWNDAPERTHSEVMAAFDKAIELAEAQS